MHTRQRADGRATRHRPDEQVPMAARGKNFTIQSELPMGRLPAFKYLTFYPYFSTIIQRSESNERGGQRPGPCRFGTNIAPAVFSPPKSDTNKSKNHVFEQPNAA